MDGRLWFAGEMTPLMGDMPSGRRGLLSRDVLDLAVADYVAAFERVQNAGDWLTACLYADIKVLLPNEVFTKLGRMTMAHSTEGRVPLREMAADLLTDASFRQSGLFDPKAVATLIRRHMRKADNHGGDILRLLMLEVWRRELHEARGPLPAPTA